MGADIKNLRTRIKSVNSTLHLTKAMELVASSKIRKANQAMFAGREYLRAVRDTVDQLTACNECIKSPYMQQHQTGKTRLIVIAGDRGLAGGYNANVFRLAKEYPNAEIIPIGKRACDRFSKSGVTVEKFGLSDAKDLAEKLCTDFQNNAFDRVGIISTKYISMMSQEAQITWVLPLEKNEAIAKRDIIFEPDPLSVLQAAIPAYVTAVLLACVRESFASEVAARRVAMDSAGKNAQQMIDELGIAYNRARQGAITQEITEIVAGSGL